MIPLISNRVKFIEAPDRGRFPYAHSLFIDDEIRVLIDTACGEENIKYFLDHPPDIILNTHFHEDHIMNNHKFHSAQIWAHSLDAPAIRSEEVFFEFYGFHYFGAERIGRLFYEWTGAKPSPVHQELQGGQILDFGKTKVQLIHAPGHTPGHCCFLFEDDILFTADIESAKGELGYYIVSDGSSKPYRLHVRAPSFINLMVLPVICRGGVFQDIITNIATLDPILGESDR